MRDEEAVLARIGDEDKVAAADARDRYERDRDVGAVDQMIRARTN
jgi:hypothetical protein